MADITQNKDRHVIPNWRSFENTAKLGELNGSKTIKLDSSFKPDISDLLDEWNDNKNLAVAGDLLGVAIVCNQNDNNIVKEIAEYINQNKQSAPTALIRASEYIVKPNKDEIDFAFEFENVETFAFRENLTILFEKIHTIKSKLIQNPHNPISWVDLARLYAINGQEIHAEKAMKNALFLAPENRFVLRNMARFFVHIGDIDFAHDQIRKAKITQYDPWVMATEIALADLRGRGSVFSKKGLGIIESNSFHPFNISELASSIGTLELSNSNVKKGKRLIEKSLLQPNDNTLAQAEWVSQEDKGLIILNPENFKLINSFEALARDAKGKGNWNEAIEFSKKWFLDLPFSIGGILFGSDVARNSLKDHSKSIEIAKLGLVSHPTDPQLLNNIVYSMCLENKLDDAEEYLNRIRFNNSENNDINMVCVTATYGLLNFRKGNLELGRKLYFEAIDQAKNLNNSYLSSLAFVNYTREEILINEFDTSTLISKLSEIKKNSKHDDLTKLADDVIELYQNKLR